VAELRDISLVLEGFLERMHSKEHLDRRGIQIVDIIKRRTRSWRDIFGARFEDYSTPYKFWRTSQSPKLAVRPGGNNVDSMMVVDSTDGMMQQIKFDSYPEKGLVEVDVKNAGKKKLASYHNILGVGKSGAHLRKWWGLADKEAWWLAGQIEDEGEHVLADLTAEAQTT